MLGRPGLPELRFGRHAFVFFRCRFDDVRKLEGSEIQWIQWDVGHDTMLAQ